MCHGGRHESAKDKYNLFAQAFDQQIRQQLSEENLQAQLCSDGELVANDFTLEVAQLLRDASPWVSTFPNLCSMVSLCCYSSVLLNKSI